MEITTTGDEFHRRRHLEVEGKRVSWLHLFDFKVRLGPITASAAGIGGVGTDRHHRMEGHSRRLMEDTLRLAAGEGYEIAVLFGIPHFYHKFGFATCAPEVRVTATTRALEALENRSPYRTREFVADDLPAIFDLFNRNNSRRPLSFVRPHGFIKVFRHASGFHKKPEIIIFEDSRSRFAGYAVADAYPDPLVVCEVEAVDAGVFPAAVAKFARMAIDRREGHASFQLPTDHPFVIALRRVGCTVEAVYSGTGGTMGRIISQHELLDKLVGAYSSERGAGLSAKLDVTVTTELGSTRLSIPSAEPASGAVEMPQEALFRLIAGFRMAEEVAASPGVEVTGGAERFLEFISPTLEPHAYGPDRF